MQKISWIRVFFDITVIIILTVISQVVFQRIPPFHNGFFCTDYSIALPFKPSTVTSIVLGIITIFSPLLIILGTEIFMLIINKFRAKKNTPSRRKDFELYLCCWGIRNLPEFFGNVYFNLVFYYLGLTITNGLTNMVKLLIGRLRPNFLAVCRPIISPYLEVCNSTVSYVIPEVDFYCKNNNLKELNDCRKSFPSGHSSLIFYSMIFLSFFIQQTWNCRHIGLLKHLVQFGLVSLAFFTASSRVQDNKHHTTDVIAGGLLGTAIGTTTYWVLHKLLINHDNIGKWSKTNVEENSYGMNN